MGKRSGDDLRGLLVRAQFALGTSQAGLGALLGLSGRTIRRWTDRGPNLTPSTLVTLATAVHAKEPALAARIAAACGQTLEELGVVRPPAPVVPTTPAPPARDPKAERLLADALVCAAAEVADVSPRTMRPALAAAFERARDAGLTIEAAHALFAEPEGPRRVSRLARAPGRS